MAGLYNLMILGVMLIGVVVGAEGVTDQQFQELSNLVKDPQDEKKKEFNDLQLTIDQLTVENSDLSSLVLGMKTEIKTLSSVVNSQASKIINLEKLLTAALSSSGTDKEPVILDKDFIVEDVIQNSTIEERVTTLELQMAVVEEEITEINEDVTGLDDDVNFLFDEQVIQDERLLNLEVASDQTEDDVESLQVTALELDFRVTELEENGGSDGNSSISELEVRVETLEGTADDHEARITTSEAEINDLQEVIDDLEARLTVAEENIQGLQMTDINHESRITALEENGGGGGGNATVAFYAGLGGYDSLSSGSTVIFDNTYLNVGDGYDNTTGVFTVPSGGDGLYYFSAHLHVQPGELGRFDIRHNDEAVCRADGDHDTSSELDYTQPSCSAVVHAVQGNEVRVVYVIGTDDTPLYAISIDTGFNGFKI